MPLPAAAPALYLRRRHEDRAKALKGGALYTGKPGEPPRGAIGGAQKAVDAISRPGRYPGSRSAARRRADVSTDKDFADDAEGDT